MNRYYINVTVHNRVGVLNRITAVFSRLQINISSLTLVDADTGEEAKMEFGFNCDENKKHLLMNRQEKLYDVFSVEELDNEDILFA